MTLLLATLGSTPSSSEVAPAPPPPPDPDGPKELEVEAIIGTEGGRISGEPEGTVWSREAIRSVDGQTFPVQGPAGSGVSLVATVRVIEIDGDRLQAVATIRKVGALLAGDVRAAVGLSVARRMVVPEVPRSLRATARTTVKGTDEPMTRAVKVDVGEDVLRLRLAEERRKQRAEKRLRVRR